MSAIGFPLWAEGLFLRPQHFQLQTRASLQADQDVRFLATPYPWGLKAIEFDDDAIVANRIRLRRLHAVFPDGADVQAPQRDPLPPDRDLSVLPENGEHVLLYIALPSWSEFGLNCAFEQQNGRPARFQQQASEFPDFFTEGSRTEVVLMRHNLRLLFEGENNEGHVVLPVARLQRNAQGNWCYDRDFIPPALTLFASTALQERLLRLSDIVMAKSAALTAHQREHSADAFEFQANDVTAYWLLHCMNGAFPLLRHYLQHQGSNPEQIYRFLISWAGHLMTFSAKRRLNDIPMYNHASPHAAWVELDELIRDLIDTVVPQKHIAIPLKENKPGMLLGHIDSERAVQGADWYIAVVTQKPAALALEGIPTKLKMGAPEDVEKLINSALPGVKLSVPQRTPPALPVRVGTHYFALDPQGAVFERMIKARSICAYVPQLFADAKITVYAVLR